MNNWNQLLVTLDKTIGFPNKITSTVKKRWQGYDLWKNEHVIWLEYRVKVNPGIHPPQRPPQFRRDVHRDPVREAESMVMIRELMDLSFAHTDNALPAPQSPMRGKKKTAKKSQIPRKARPNPPASPIKPA